MVNLTWAQRIQICLDIAHGINYLHIKVEGKPSIIHRDIKSENILLDENLNAKIGDFGLSKFHNKNQQTSTIYTKHIAGTEVYLDPEYLKTSGYKKESDIYSFGVVLFEVLSGRVAYDSVYLRDNAMGLAPVARRRFNEGTLKELIDPNIMEGDADHIFTLNRGPNQKSFDTFSMIAYQCLAETQAKRPTMNVVIKELQYALNLQGDNVVLSKFQLRDIQLATKNFDKTYCIGSETNGMVYKAELFFFGNTSTLATEGDNKGEPDSIAIKRKSKKRITVAIKRIAAGKEKQGKQAFCAELELHTSYKHPNIVACLGFCEEGDEMIIVYEHASKKSLNDCLKSIDSINNITWNNRLHMCLEIARGLHHLHTKNLHGDINSANILLHKNWEAKIAYFGFFSSTNQDVGMKVYRDPESVTKGDLGTKSDIYSFGVVLFEIFCGRLAYDPLYMEENDNGLAPIALKCFDDGTIERIIDMRLKEETDEDIFTSSRGPNRDSLDAYLKIAHLCLGETAERPTMKIVIKELEIALNLHEIFLKKLQISLKDIKSATKNFSPINCIGRGRYWKVYKGELPCLQDDANTNDGGCATVVAKRWNSKFGEGDHQFRSESNILFKSRHENIIGLVGYCNEMDEKIIVYEHMSKGSLDIYLKDANLTYIKRLEICIDVGSGLDFLHQGDVTLKKVVHRHIRSTSILLNDDWKAKISKLGSSSLDSLHKDMEHVSDDAYATSCYLDPQYKQGFLNEKSDIYSFGVVLFEILCGRLAWEEDCKDISQSLGPWAKRCYEEEKVDEMVFEAIKEQICPESLAIFVDIAYQCIHDKGEERPTGRQVVIQLKKALNVQLLVTNKQVEHTKRKLSSGTMLKTNTNLLKGWSNFLIKTKTNLQRKDL